MQQATALNSPTLNEPPHVPLIRDALSTHTRHCTAPPTSLVAPSWRRREVPAKPYRMAHVA